MASTTCHEDTGRSRTMPRVVMHNEVINMHVLWHICHVYAELYLNCTTCQCFSAPCMGGVRMRLKSLSQQAAPPPLQEKKKTSFFKPIYIIIFSGIVIKPTSSVDDEKNYASLLQCQCVWVGPGWVNRERREEQLRHFTRLAKRKKQQ